MTWPPHVVGRKIYHIVHVDRLASIIADGCLFSNHTMVQRAGNLPVIGIHDIKARRQSLAVKCRPGLTVGQCVPFYFCPRSVMLYLIYKRNHPELTFLEGQSSILHLQADLVQAIDWAQHNGRRWAFTLSNAGSNYFEDRCTVEQLVEINWTAVDERWWSGRNVSPAVKEAKQAEFLIEESLPWSLIERIGTCSPQLANTVTAMVAGRDHRPPVSYLPGWYY